MESGRPKSFEQFSQFVPQSFSGFLHRAGELLGDTDYGAIYNRLLESTQRTLELASRLADNSN